MIVPLIITVRDKEEKLNISWKKGKNKINTEHIIKRTESVVSSRINLFSVTC